MEARAAVPLKSRVKLVVRPDSIVLDDSPADATRLAGRIVKSTYVGRAVEHMVETALGPLFVVARPGAGMLAAGQEVSVTIAQVPVALPG